MRKLIAIKYKFVECIPDKLEDGMIYISAEYATAVHKCCCGCQSKLVTPLSRKDWRLTYDGETVTLHPSIGNFQFNCRSHYWIRENKIIWLPEEKSIFNDRNKTKENKKKARWFNQLINHFVKQKRN
jgi:hypothetical protein